MSEYVPLEDEEQAALVQWLRLKGYPHFRVPSETYTKSWKQKAKNKALGVVSGVPDLFIVTSSGLVAIEMKRIKGSVTSPEQHQRMKPCATLELPCSSRRALKKRYGSLNGKDLRSTLRVYRVTG